MNHPREWLLTSHIPYLLSSKPGDKESLIMYAASKYHLYKDKPDAASKGIAQAAAKFYKALADSEDYNKGTLVKPIPLTRCRHPNVIADILHGYASGAGDSLWIGAVGPAMSEEPVKRRARDLAHSTWSLDGVKYRAVSMMSNVPSSSIDMPGRRKSWRSWLTPCMAPRFSPGFLSSQMLESLAVVLLIAPELIRVDWPEVNLSRLWRFRDNT
ncbi:uncharacterized protein MYCFIDRAFT_206455 [Pseudocercospora fijiensis CIRAD86]|uniref:Uncharacterized protein n=1 Tax=Pseudocercospora fijiensis (strain CIRAD86) TaxID=383855 RepID=M3A272_PSEFD|nr:uncharacterized protein MYCFIDRAFT_206455 [Pseudocercospora fijiensis CIRAD86]EME85264.1 hypothetical protein MYCFIDRAFT_206455 [Pseudocercospora fijiensis CIRAD86]